MDYCRTYSGAGSAFESQDYDSIAMASAVATGSNTGPSMNLDNQILHHNGTTGSGAGVDTAWVLLERASATDTDATREDTTSSSITQFFREEYADGIISSIQEGVALMDNTTFNVTISAVDVNKVKVHLLGWSNSTADAGRMPRIELTSSTNLRFHAQDNGSSDVSFLVAEYN